jgi:hypothetical protein
MLYAFSYRFKSTVMQRVEVPVSQDQIPRSFQANTHE